MMWRKYYRNSWSLVLNTSTSIIIKVCTLSQPGIATFVFFLFFHKMIFHLIFIRNFTLKVEKVLPWFLSVSFFFLITKSCQQRCIEFLYPLYPCSLLNQVSCFQNYQGEDRVHANTIFNLYRHCGSNLAPQCAPGPVMIYYCHCILQLENDTVLDIISGS